MIKISAIIKLGKGEELYEERYDDRLKKNVVEYNYRTKSGKLFGTVALTLKKCRAVKDQWVEAGEVDDVWIGFE